MVHETLLITASTGVSARSVYFHTMLHSTCTHFFE